MPVLICYLLSYDRMRFLHSLSRILSKAKIAGLLQSLLGGGYAKHCHVNTKKNLAHLLCLNLSSSPANMETRLFFHGHRRGFGLLLQEIDIVKDSFGLVWFGSVQFSTRNCSLNFV